MKQCDRILEFIDEHGQITDEDAKNMRPQIHRLAARIFELRNRGHNIITETVCGKNEYGPWRCASYKKAV